VLVSDITITSAVPIRDSFLTPCNQMYFLKMSF